MTTIQIQKIYPPKQSGWSASIKAADGNYYGLKENLANTLSEGQTIEADVAIKERNGKTYRDITKLYNAPVADAPAPRTNGNGHAPHPYSQSGLTQKDEMIFVCGFVNNWVRAIASNTAISAPVLEDVVNIAREAWANTFGKK